jgi:2-polyprenyl-6-hydroxyphenyl methylase / 3-demethylubiquinone-9 3-methyltransferase
MDHGCIEMKSTVNIKEINHFQNDSQNWWKEDGPFSPLHALNPVRLRFIRDAIDQNSNTISKSRTKPLSGLDILDIGCGGGLTCEPLARLGANVTGLDADAQAIKIATDHAKSGDLKITYAAEPVETYRKRVKARYDVVLALEIIEHVQNPDEFVAQVVDAAKPGGLIVFSTLNKTVKSLVLGIWAAEYLLGWVPPGTHDWHQFIKPSTLNKMLAAHKCSAIDAAGIVVDPFTRGFKLSKTDLDVNYLMAFQKK